MDDSDVDDESVAPEPVGDAVNAQNLPSAAGGGAGPPPPAAAQHPVWAAAAGRGRSAAKNKPDSVFGPISMIELEIRGRNDLDGASSTASDHGGGGRRGKDASKQPAKKRRAGAATKRPREYDDDDDDDDNEGGRGGDSGEDGDADGAESTASADMAGAAFGGGAATKKRACVPCGSEMSDDGASVTSSVVRARHERAFPVTGVTCVGCALPAKIQPVIDFIAKNMSTMSELALYKMAALVYKTKVAEPAEEEGVDVPPWGAPFCPFALSPFRAHAGPLLARRLEGDPRALPAARGRLAHAAVREHPHALGDAQDPGDAAAAPRPGDGRAVARQEQRRVHHEDHRRQQSRAHAPRRPRLHQEARVRTGSGGGHCAARGPRVCVCASAQVRKCASLSLATVGMRL
jgi:hypothetical protein